LPSVAEPTCQLSQVEENADEAQMNEPSKLWGGLLSMVGQDGVGDMPQDTSTYT